MAFADRFVADGSVAPAGYRQLSGDSVTGISIGNARVAFIQALNQNIRMRDDGSDPTTSTGLRLHAGQTIWYLGDCANLKMIGEASGAEINILAYK